MGKPSRDKYQWQAKGTFSEEVTFQYLSEEKRLVLQKQVLFHIASGEFEKFFFAAQV